MPADPAPAATGMSTGLETWSVTRLLRGLLFFALLTGVGLWILARRGVLGNGFAALGSVRPVMLLLGLLLAALDQLIAGARIWLCARALGGRVGLGPAVLANCANVFLGGVTPSQSGGGPAQIWILSRHGLGITEAAVLSLWSYLGTVLVFIGLAVLLTLGHPVLPVEGALRVFTGSTIVVFTAILVLTVVAIPQPARVLEPFRGAVRRVPRWGAGWAASPTLRHLERALAVASTAMHTAFGRGKLRLIGVLLLSAAIFLNKFLIAYVVVRALGIAAPLHDVLYLQALQALVIYFAPTPGASGFAEVTSAAIMGHVVPASSLGAFVILWRIFALYLGMIFGAVVIVRSGFATLRPPGRARLTPGGSSVVG